MGVSISCHIIYISSPTSSQSESTYSITILNMKNMPIVTCTDKAQKMNRRSSIDAVARMRRRLSGMSQDGEQQLSSSGEFQPSHRRRYRRRRSSTCSNNSSDGNHYMSSSQGVLLPLRGSIPTGKVSAGKNGQTCRKQELTELRLDNMEKLQRALDVVYLNDDSDSESEEDDYHSTRFY